MDSHRRRAAAVIALVLAIAFAGLLVTAPASKADFAQAPWGDYGDFSQATNFNRAGPVTVSDGSGSLYVFYTTTNRVSGVTNLNVTKFASGGFFNAPSELFDKQVNDVSNVVDPGIGLAAAVDAAGNVYVAWVRMPTGGFSQQIYVSKSSDGGDTWLPAVHASELVPGPENVLPAIATAPDGTVYVAWTQLWSPFENITVAKSLNGGSSFTALTNASGQGRGGAAEYPSITVDSGGRVYLAYFGISSVPFNLHVNVTWSNDGTTWAAPHQVTPMNTYAFYPDIVASGGHVHLVWLDFRGIVYGNLAVWYTRSDDRGATWLAQSPISQGRAQVQSFPYLTAFGNTLVTVWAGYNGTRDGLSYSISATDGGTWYPEKFYNPGYNIAVPTSATDMNGTVFVGAQDISTSPNSGVTMLFWNSPPTAPVITSVASGSGSLTVTWQPGPEHDVVAYQIYRSVAGSAYEYLATVNSPALTYTDSGLADGTYSYRVVAVDNVGLSGPESVPMSGTVGPTTQALIAQLNAEIASLQDQLAEANASTAAAIAAAQARITALQTQLTNLQNSQAASNSATAAQLAQLQANLTALQQRLSDVQSAQATQTISYANLAFEVIVVVLLIVVLLNQMRKPKNPRIMMAQPGQAEPKNPGDEL